MIVLAYRFGVKRKIGQDPHGRPHQDEMMIENIQRGAIEKSATIVNLIKIEMLQFLHLKRHHAARPPKDLHKGNLVAMGGLLLTCLMVVWSKTVRIDLLRGQIVLQRLNLPLGQDIAHKILPHETWTRHRHHLDLLQIANHQLGRGDTVGIILMQNLLCPRRGLIQPAYIQTA